MASSPSSAPHPVDQVPPFGKLTILGIQHVLAFYAGAVVVPLVIASGLGLDHETLVHLINADLLTCGIATIIQSAGIGRFIGVKLPLIQGVTFTAVSPLIAIGAAATPPGADPRTGLATMYGSIIAVGLIVFLVAPFFAKLLRFFPPIVTGTLLTVMGTTLISVSAGDIVAWADKAADDAAKTTATYEALGLAFGTIAIIIIIIQRLFKGFMGTLSVLLGLLIMTAVAFAAGKTDFSGVGEASWVAITTPFYFGIPKFSLTAIIAMIIVMAVTAVETTGDVFATGEVVGKRIAPRDIANALRADGLSTLLGGVLNSFPYTCFAQNVGLVRLTRVKSRWVVTTAGVFMIVLGLLPKAAAIVAAIPQPVIGGASLAMFANVAVVGIQTLSKVDLRDNRNAVIVSTSIGLALLVTLKPGIVSVMPSWLQIIFGSGVTIGSLTAIILNLLFFHIGRPASPDVAVVDGKKINLDDVNEMDRQAFVSAFSKMFTTKTWPAERAWEARPFASVSELRSSFEDAVLSATPQEAEELIASYADIVSLVLDGQGDEQSLADTSNLSIGELTDKEAEELRALATAYRTKFGRPLVICVDNVVDRKHLLESGWRRVEHSPAREARFALGEVIDIADLRFDQLVADANPMRAAWDAGVERF